MKKMFFGLIAIVIAAASVAFTNHHKFVDCLSSVYWFHVSTSVSKACNDPLHPILNTDFDMLPTADGADDTDPSNNITASQNQPYNCPTGTDEACAVGYATTASNFEVIDIGIGTHDYRWRVKAGITKTCCVTRAKP